MLGVDWQVYVAVMIIAGFTWAVWRGGSKNPVGTGMLQKQLNAIGGEVLQLKGQLGTCALATEVQELRGEIKEMRAGLASSGEVIALEGQMAVVNERVTGICRIAERTEQMVQRIEGHFLRRGIDGGRE